MPAPLQCPGWAIPGPMRTGPDPRPGASAPSTLWLNCPARGLHGNWDEEDHDDREDES